MMTYRLLLFCLSLFLCVLNGCGGGPAKPADFPDLVRPVTIKIHKGGTPLNNITVILHSKDAALQYLVTGVTGSDGVATIQTSRNTYGAPGVPAGKYLVQLTEVLNVDLAPLGMDVTPQQEAAWTKEYNEKADKIRSFSKVLTKAGTTPLEIDVASSPATVEFDVSTY